MGFLSKEKPIFTEYDYKALNNIKALALDMIKEAESGHSGVVFSAAPIIYDIFARHLVFNNKDDKWINRDRFVLSCGHASSLLYSTLYMCGFKLTIDDLKAFRTLNSKTPGHPEIDITPGVDISTGLLGEGFANAIGMAISERFLNKRYGSKLIDHYTYVLCSDGDLMEGVSYEAASVAGNLSLGKLIVLYDSNNVTLDNTTKETFKENVIDRFKAMNWDTYSVSNDLKEIDDAITKAKNTDKPSFIEVKTIIGETTLVQGTPKAHSYIPTDEELSKIKESLGVRDIPFSVSKEAYDYLTERTASRNNKIIYDYNINYERIKEGFEFKDEYETLCKGKYSIDLKDLTLDPTEDEQRNISHEIINKIVNRESLIMLGSADLATSTKVYSNMGDFTSSNREGRNILFGVREHAMGAILNGIASTGIKVIGSTFLTLSDYLKPSIRMASMMNLPVTYIFTHDTFLVGKDGPTHHPIEQLTTLRSIPNLTVYRPYDMNELIGSYKSAFKNNNPSAIIVSKEKVEVQTDTSIKDVEKGAYIIKDFDQIMGIIIATGTEVATALEISKRLEEEKIYIRVVSMPSMELFEIQDEKYKEMVLPYTYKKVVIEYGSSYSWHKYVYNDKYLFNINEYSKSASKEDLLKEKGYDIDTLTKRVKDLFI